MSYISRKHDEKYDDNEWGYEEFGMCFMRRLTGAWLISGGGTSRPKMTLNLDGGVGSGNSDGNGVGLQMLKKPGGLSLGLPLELTTTRASADLVDVELPLERQGWVY